MPKEVAVEFSSCEMSGGHQGGDAAADLATIYPIVEIFHSVQGEGAHTGLPRIFIRFGRCNLRCEWCDTNFDEWKDSTVVDILGEIMEFDCQNIVFTGGEPALQNLWPLARCLKSRDYHLSIETNGTIELPEGLIDWVCVSPKDQLYPDVGIKQRCGDELKVVFCGQDLSLYDELIDGFDHLFLQPCYFENESVEWNGKNFQATESLVKANPGWRLSLQTQKWLGVL